MKARILFVTAILILAPLAVFAMGNSEKPYGVVLDEEFTEIVTALENGDIDLAAAIEQLHELRVENNREDGPEYREMEQIMEAVQLKTMNTLQARERLHQLEESDCDMTGTQIRHRERTMTKLQDKAGDGSGTDTVPAEGTGDAGKGTDSPGAGSGAAASGSEAKRTGKN